MVEPRILYEVFQAPGHAGLRVRSTEDHTRYPSENHRPGAMGAGLQGGVQGAPLQAPVSETTSGAPNGQRLRVGRGIAVLGGAVVSLRDDLATADDHSADRHLSAKRRRACQLQCPCHPGTVGIGAGWDVGDAAQCATEGFANEPGSTRR